MQFYILAVGEKAPSWVDAGVNQYLSRMPHECKVNFIPITAAKRSKNQTIEQAKVREQEQLVKHTPKDSLRIALDEHGKLLTTKNLAVKLSQWMQTAPIITLYIGGPDGLSKEFLAKSDFVWSLSKLTMPHMLVRVLLVEQLYRAWTITQGHPYHRD